MPFLDKLNGWIIWMTANREKLLRYSHGLQILVGLFLLLMGWFMGHTQFHLIGTGTRTQGKIIGSKTEYFRRSESAMGSTAYMPVVEIQVENRTFRFTNWLGSPISPTLNQIVPVLYDASQPSVAIIDRPVMNWIPWAPISVVGLFLLLVGITGLLKRTSPER
jgi:hypothetical protein